MMPNEPATAPKSPTADAKKVTATKPRIATVVTDLDNTLFDWVEMWGASFTAMLDVVLAKSGIPRDVLLPEIRVVHQRHHTAEYAFLIQNLPSLTRLHPDMDLTEVYADAIQAYKDARARSLRLYAGVRETLDRLKAAGCQIIGYTESQSFYSSYRIRTLGLDGVLDALFSPADHDRPHDFKRSKPDDAYRLLRTRHEHTPTGEYKPNPDILNDILKKVGANKEATIYVGDSLMKDVAMAQDAGVLDVHAKYGEATHREVYELLRLVTHWSDEDVAREKRINSRGSVTPTYVLRESMTELFDLFDFRGGTHVAKNVDQTADVDPEAALTRNERVDVAMDAWKKAVDVQMHFNDIEIRIRNLAITFLGAVFSVAGLMLKDNPTSNLPGWVVLIGGFLSLAFFFMDGGWYHRLLHGAVEHGRSLENYIVTSSDVPVGLANTIKQHSPLDTWFGQMRSDHKILTFYSALFGVSVVFAIILWISAANARTDALAKLAIPPKDALAVVAQPAGASTTNRDSLAAARRADSLRLTSGTPATSPAMAPPGRVQHPR